MAIHEKELQKAKDVAYRFLSYRPRSKKEVVQRLELRGFGEKIIKTVLNTLEEYSYINDEKFAPDWANYRLENRPVGKRRLVNELREKGIAQEIIEKTITETYKKRDESKMTRELAERRLVSYKGLDDKVIRRRLFAFLMRRGFSIDDSRKAIDEVLKR